MLIREGIYATGRDIRKCSIDDETIKSILELYESGVTLAKIRKDFGLAKTTLTRSIKAYKKRLGTS